MRRIFIHATHRAVCKGPQISYPHTSVDVLLIVLLYMQFTKQKCQHTHSHSGMAPGSMQQPTREASRIATAQAREREGKRARERGRASINCTCCSCCYYCCCCWVLCCFACILFYFPLALLSLSLCLSRSLGWSFGRGDVAKLLWRGILCSFLACLPLVALGLSSSLVRPSLCRRCKRMGGGEGRKWEWMGRGGLKPLPPLYHCCILFSYILLLLLYFALFCAVFCFAAALGPWLRVMYRYDRRLVARLLHPMLL